MSKEKEPRTPSLFEEILDEEFSWRIQEMSNFRNNIPRDKNSLQKVLLRAGIALLYAHWEGFVKKASNTYYKYLTYQNDLHKISDFQPPLLAHLIKKNLDSFLDTKRVSKASELFSTLTIELNKNAFFPPQNPIKTSNLDYNVFQDVCTLTIIETSKFGVIDMFLNDLLEMRNTIAHGNRGEKDGNLVWANFEQIYKKIVEMLRIFKTEISNTVSLKRYLL